MLPIETAFTINGSTPQTAPYSAPVVDGDMLTGDAWELLEETVGQGLEQLTSLAHGLPGQLLAVVELASGLALAIAC